MLEFAMDMGFRLALGDRPMTPLYETEPVLTRIVRHKH